jgi:hypothetical protein
MPSVLLMPSISNVIFLYPIAVHSYNAILYSIIVKSIFEAELRAPLEEHTRSLDWKCLSS